LASPTLVVRLARIINSLLAGYRGRPRGDLAAAIQAIEAVQSLVLAQPDSIVELEINPLIVSAEGEGAFAADALVVRREASHA
jgi:hypothetical protein